MDKYEDLLRMHKLVQMRKELQNQLETIDFLSDDEKEWELVKFEQLATKGQVYEI